MNQKRFRFNLSHRQLCLTPAIGFTKGTDCKFNIAFMFLVFQFCVGVFKRKGAGEKWQD